MTNHDSTVYAQGCDYAFAPYPTAAELLNAGKTFVCRYLSGGPADGKDITASELNGLLNGGVKVVFNWETGGTMNSQSQGVSDATAAKNEVAGIAAALPTYSAAILAAPIIFSADFDPTSGTLAAIEAYMTGVQSVLGKARTGIYGGIGAINAVANAGIGTYFWQTSAWSSGQVSSFAQIYQYAYNGSVSGISVDLDEALAENYGYIGSGGGTTEVPGAVTGLEVTGSTDTSVAVAWAATPNATSYNVGYDQGSNWHGSVTTNAVNFTGLTEGLAYTFTVTAEPSNDGGVSSIQATPGGVPTGPHWDTSPLVEEGDTGVLVEVVQYLLNQAGASLTVDGNFGALTLSALESFQSAHDISATGQVHGYTWPVLAVVVQNGSNGNAVKAVQVALNATGASLTVDGADGPATTAAVEAFQTHSGLPSNGTVDVADNGTWNALVNAA